VKAEQMLRRFKGRIIRDKPFVADWFINLHRLLPVLALVVRPKLAGVRPAGG
jgi:hypothetical protein